MIARSFRGDLLAACLAAGEGPVASHRATGALWGLAGVEDRLETDSYARHSSRTDWARDHVRNRELVAAGWRLLPVTWDDLRHRPETVARLVEEALRVAGRR